MENDFTRENEHAEAISKLRSLGDLDKAIVRCLEAIACFPNNNFFYKILGDMYFQIGENDKAANAYIENLKRLGDKQYQFRTFIRFFNLLKQRVSNEFLISYKKEIAGAVWEGEIPKVIADKLRLFLGDDFLIDAHLAQLISLSNKDTNAKAFELAFKKLIDNNDDAALNIIVNHRISTEPRNSNRINRLILTSLEKAGRYRQALNLLTSLIENGSYNPNLVRTLFRICRQLDDYAIAEQLININESFIAKSDFNVLYELVYFFEHGNDMDNLSKTLSCMEHGASSSIPIARTLYNFYLRFDMFEEARAMFEHINQLVERSKENKAESRRAEQIESEQAVWQRLKDLVSEQEHNHQMIALRDLLRGFSHELGQPITNIRYSAQLQEMRLASGEASIEDVRELIDVVLAQTERIGKLLGRFRPIVSSKTENVIFCVSDRIQQVVDNMDARLKGAKIAVNVQYNGVFSVMGDPVQFDQVFYNLMLNAIQAMKPNVTTGEIRIKVYEFKPGICGISFSDNGIGIPYELSKKVFEPFFSTKDPMQSEGNEGLGLFIVWNILKMFGGKIKLDAKCMNGARFLIQLPIKETDNSEQSINH